MMQKIEKAGVHSTMKKSEGSAANLLALEYQSPLHLKAILKHVFVEIMVSK